VGLQGGHDFLGAAGRQYIGHGIRGLVSFADEYEEGTESSEVGVFGFGGSFYAC
jgi:hypothetical protein